MAACNPEDAHRADPRRLLGFHERANGAELDGEGIQAWLEWEWEATRWRVPAEISRADLEDLVERGAELPERERQGPPHESDRQRWGRRGGLATVGRYGRSWMALLALRRWGRIDKADLEAARPLR